MKATNLTRDVASAVNLDKFETMARTVLNEAKRLGASATEVSLASNIGFAVTVHDAKPETVEYHQDKAIDIKVYFGQRTGTASVTDIRLESVTAAVAAACHIAKFTDSDDAAGLAVPEELAFNYPSLKLAANWQISVPEAINLACECERLALAQDKRIMSAESVNVTTSYSFHLYANSHDFLGHFPYTRHDISCILVAKEKNDMQREYAYTLACNPQDLQPISWVAEQAAQRTIQRLGARRLSTRKAPVLFLADEARSLLRFFVAAIKGGNLYRHSSFLLDKLDQPIFPSFVTIKEEPHLEYGLGSAPFDSDGVATRPNIFIKDGNLVSYALGVYSARRLGMKTTGNAGGVRNLSITPGNHDFAGLINLMQTGLVVTETMGSGVNLVTGDYSHGVGGYWIENGVFQYPVQEITIAGRLQDMFANLVAVGNDIDPRGNIRTGSILLAEMTIAGA